jgi:hypothetical protein
LRPGEIAIGPGLLDLLERWANQEVYRDAAKNMTFLAVALRGRGKEVMRYLGEEGSARSVRILDRIVQTAHSEFRRHGMAEMINVPLYAVKKEVLGAGD